MTPKEYLTQVQTFEEQVDDEAEYIESLRESLISMGIDYSKDRVQTSSTDSIGKIISKVIDGKKTLEKMREKSCTFRCQVIDQIHDMDNPVSRQILTLKYIQWRENRTLKDVAKHMSYSYRYVLELHENALFEFRTLYFT